MSVKSTGLENHKQIPTEILPFTSYATLAGTSVSSSVNEKNKSFYRLDVNIKY